MRRVGSGRPDEPILSLSETAREYTRRTGKPMTKKTVNQVETVEIRKIRERLEELGVTEQDLSK